MRRMLVVLACLLICGSCRAADTDGGVAPDFSLKSTEGKTVTLSGFKGEVVVLNFWATWCPPCRAEIPDFVEFYNAYKEKGVVVLGIVLNSPDKDVQNMIQQNKISYPVLISDGKVEEKYGGIRFIPTTIIVDRAGRIVKRQVGGMKKPDLEAAAKGL